MKNKKVLGIIIGVVLVIAIAFTVMFLKERNKSINIKLNKNYKAAIEMRINSSIILLIDDNNKISNILYLNDNSVKTFANQGIERKSLEKGIELIVDKLKNNKEFDNKNQLVLVNYKDSDSIYSKVLEELNKEFVVYGVDNKILEQEYTLKDKISVLQLKDSDNEIQTLYDYSKKLLKNSIK